LRAEFGPRIAGIVDGVGELDQPEHIAALERHLLNVNGPPAPADVCVLAVKIADRLHNMQTIKHLHRNRQVAKSHQTLALVVPLAHLLGFAAVKRELEELAFSVLRPPGYVSGGPAAIRAVLRLLGWLLPTRSRARWVQEWIGELAMLPGRAARIAFLLRIAVFSLPRLAIVLRRDRIVPAAPRLGGYVIRAAGTVVAGVTVAGVGISPQAGLWVGVAGVLAATVLLACVLFGRDDTAARRLAQIIHAWRRNPDDQ
jgi:hypothetical protein